MAGDGEGPVIVWAQSAFRPLCKEDDPGHGELSGPGRPPLHHAIHPSQESGGPLGHVGQILCAPRVRPGSAALGLPEGLGYPGRGECPNGRLPMSRDKFSIVGQE
eukprot:15449435-Alexandrium_andersonii.AAC.1